MSNQLFFLHRSLRSHLSAFHRKQPRPREISNLVDHQQVLRLESAFAFTACGRSSLSTLSRSRTQQRVSPGLTTKHPCSVNHRRFLGPAENTADINNGGQSRYVTNAKVQMTSSLHKWKNKKRKSKAQQKKELDNLHKSMMQLFSRRAIELAQNKSLLGGHREVVTTHAFNEFRICRDEDHTVYSIPSIEIDPHSFVRPKPTASEFSAKTLKSSVEKAPYFKQTGKDTTISLSQISSLPVLQSLEIGTKNKGDEIDSSAHSQIHSLNYRDFFPLKLPSKPVIKQELEQEHFVTRFDSFQARFSAGSSRAHDWHDIKVSSSDSPGVSSSDHAVDKKVDSYKKDTGFTLNHDETSRLQQKSKIGARTISLDENLGTLSHFETPKVSKVVGVGDVRTRAERKGMKVKDTALTDRQSERLGDLVTDVTTTMLKTDRLSKRLRHNKLHRVRRPNISKELQDLMDKAFVEASCFTGCEKTALRNLKFGTSNTSSIEVFNRLLRTFAKKADMQTIQSVLSMMRQKEVMPDLQTYAAVLECIGRKSYIDPVICEKVIENVEKDGLDLTEIANTCSFEQDEMDFILSAIRLVRPDFELKEPTLNSMYGNDLLLPLNQRLTQGVNRNQYALVMSQAEMRERLLRQMEMECQGDVQVPSIYTGNKDSASSKMRRLRVYQLNEWRQTLLASFENRLARCNVTAEDNTYMTLYPYLKLFPSEIYVDIIFKTLRELFRSSEAYSLSQHILHRVMGREVNNHFNIEFQQAAGLCDKMKSLYESYSKEYLDPEHCLTNQRLMWQAAMNRQPDTVNMDVSTKKWPIIVFKQVGQFLLDMILNDLKIDANLLKPGAPQRMVPAFSTIFRPTPDLHLVNHEVKMHPVVSSVFRVETVETFSFHPSVVPMIVPPVPWVSKHMGGLLLGSNGLIRLPDDLGHMDWLKGVDERQFHPTLDSLNTLSACAWKINQPILDLQMEIFNNKGDASLKVAPPSSECPPLPTVSQDLSGQEKAELYRERKMLQQQKEMMHGLWCSDLYRLSIAHKFRDEVFWFPHSMDFRGRTYPLPPHFNHLGSDNVRSMLLFAMGKPLGPEGYNWLKIHLVNLTGFKKRCSNKERLEFANSIMEDILDSAQFPLTGKKWWQGSDEPWQTLAVCKEIAKIEQFEGSKEDYVCHFPVHQDGSCNGLQHYAALGRDQAGAESVNLFPFDMPQDVYSDVVELVERERKKDAENGVEIAKVLEGVIKRKVIKQTVMTTVYGVTRHGAKLQIFRQLKDLKVFPVDKAWEASQYLTVSTFNCLREMFTATRDIQDWLTEAATQISGFQTVDWVTPLGFPVVQPYYKKGKSSITGKVERHKPNIMKQKNAFPPNYIHSLDSTHMMLTSLYCMRAGITFVSVHDCYWTHACDVQIMNKICRQQFVNMHQQPLLEDLSNYLSELVSRAAKDPSLEAEMKKVDVASLNALLKAVPKRGTFDLNKVMESTYFFS